MKQRLILFITIITMGCLVQAQDEKLSVTVAYPLPLGDNFLSEYSGVADLGVQYRFLEEGTVTVGLSANAGYFSWNRTLSQLTIKDQLFLVQPRVFGELNAQAISGFRPFLGLGYSILVSKTKFDSDQTSDTSDSTGALNVNFGAAYDFTDKLFGFVSYDYLNVSRDNPNLQPSYFIRGNVLKLGVGLRF